MCSKLMPSQETALRGKVCFHEVNTGSSATEITSAHSPVLDRESNIKHTHAEDSFHPEVEQETWFCLGGNIYLVGFLTMLRLAPARCKLTWLRSRCQMFSVCRFSLLCQTHQDCAKGSWYHKKTRSGKAEHKLFKLSSRSRVHRVYRTPLLRWIYRSPNEESHLLPWTTTYLFVSVWRMDSKLHHLSELSVLVPVSWRPLLPKSAVCSDWSAHTGLSRHGPFRFASSLSGTFSKCRLCRIFVDWVLYIYIYL